ncbi:MULTISPECIES: alpha/beta hydrolase [unclassified Rhodococcus (in: high G+C Gram-positive bacteria)]|jgi:acetyl esterase/lipase|uniref:alpha/beta hydrolase n=2 Tax=Rhodococcus TaxID=1827 RepID=UPI000AE92E29|nr:MULTISPECIES: alpha/beta hydrolase [unclassified Rhodococcus (in: high G+C Gram-positive bacteria)]MDQ1181264.1 acetyl esterase/lipase [Rhodococcus sp. SORGH_AS_0301]
MSIASAEMTAPSSLTRTSASRRVRRALGVGTAVDRQEFEGGSMQSKLLAAYLRRTVRPFLGVWARTHSLPWPMSMVDQAGRLLPPVGDTTVAPVRLDECRAEWVRTDSPRRVGADGRSERPTRRADRDRVILYLHGGAFVVCGLNSHRRLVSRIAQSTGADVLSVDYRMMPRNPISHAVEDGVDGFRYLLDAGYLPEQIFIAGDSAGGYLAFMVALALQSQGLPPAGGIIALSPLTDLDPTRKMLHPNASLCSVFPKGAVPALTELADEVEARIVVDGKRGPRVCPVDADLSALPPVLIQVGSTEMVYADSELMAERLADAGIECRLQVWQDQVHVFHAADFVPESARAISEIAVFVDEQVRRGTVPLAGTGT